MPGWTVPQEPARKSTTGHRLHLLRAWLLAATVAVLATSLAAFTGVQSTVETIRTRTAPAVVGAAAAADALVRANSAAVSTFGEGHSTLAGPGAEYQNQIGIAGQSLAQVAEDNVAGTASSRELQLVQGLLVSYTSGMAQAEIRYRTTGDSLPAASDVWYAATMLHGPDGILSHLDRLRTAQQDALREQLSSGWLHPAAVVVWAVPIVVLGSLLVRTQLFCARRFRRTFNGCLLAAGGVLIGLTVLTALSVPALVQARSGAATLSQEMTQWQVRADAATAADRRAVAELVIPQCRESGCGDTLTAFAAEALESREQVPSADRLLADTGERVDRELAAAQWPSLTAYLIAGAATAIAVLVALGLRARIGEYRFRS